MITKGGFHGVAGVPRQAQKGGWKKGDGSFHSFEMFVFSNSEFYEVNTHLVVLHFVYLRFTPFPRGGGCTSAADKWGQRTLTGPRRK